MRHQGLELFVGRVEARDQPAAALVHLFRQGRELRQPRAHLIHELAARLDLRHGLRQPVGVAQYRLDRRPYFLHRRQLGTQRLDRTAHLSEPGLRAGLPLPCARDLTLGDPHALERFLHFLVCPLEAREVAQCGVDRRLRPFETRHTLRHLRDGVREPFCFRLNSSELLGVGLEVCHRLGESAELRHESVGLRLDVPDGAGGLL